MRVYGFAALAALISGPALAEPTIVDACLRAVAIDVKAENVTASDVQSFPDLSPPRVQLVANYNVTVEPDEMAKLLGAKPSKHRRTLEARCSFKNATAPFELASLACPGFECHVSSERLEELQVLLRREGF